MKRILLSLSLVAAFFTLKAQDCSDLIISEYVEGSQYNKALEIYNTSTSAIDMSQYEIVRFNNGTSTPGSPLVLSNDGDNMLQPGATHVVVNGQTDGTVDPSLVAKANQRCSGVYAESPVYWNGNDAVVLRKVAGSIVVDLIGKVGEDPGEGWYNEPPYTTNNFWEPWTKDNVMIRKASIKDGVKTNPIEFNPSVEWDTIPEDTWTELGSHTCDCHTSGTGINDAKVTTGFVFAYPNPVTNGELSVSANKIIMNTEIINAIGQVLLRATNEEEDAFMVLHLEGIYNGVYFLKTEFIDKSYNVEKIIVR